MNQWLKKAVLLYFRTHDNTLIDARYTRFCDKVPLKYAARSQADEGALLTEGTTRVVPPAVAAFPQVRWWCRATCPPRKANTRSIARSL